MSTKTFELQQKVFQNLVLLGEEVHYRLRKKEIEDPKLQAISDEICMLESELAKENKVNMVKKEEKICPSCGKVLEEGTNFCNGCGLDIRKFYSEQVTECNTCESLIEKEAAYCNICGSKQI